ncbi:FKBP-type peptidyl-prolyl cis-trans isomerase [Halomonas eurihalina]|uniref:Peptidyl-prolyl cis-trans isomerase n=1 Tax=Halomonas eurihalina TaxID=42566 RepID=A0A5D9CVB7_HALER|nr:FKBP-type peptidyl-prolyl cis-trans isomerase [Halomonas eurihalina]MDR5860859.1 FKBP-type peptidyl-prolyl cis-trans isomerase [Halomonas eurihalina]TZG35848.1 FKBP-type peptidyl-prolyl cis-trans isomerase [Halomonas eurihalina]
MSDQQANGHRIDEGMQVTLHFTLKLEDGTVVDSTRDKQPATFQVGDGNLPPGFEHPIKGLAAGENGSYEVSPEHAFGQHNPQNVQMIARDDFGDETPEMGMVMSFADVGGGELPGVIKQVGDTQVEVDFNHPLAGRTLTFEVEVLDVQPATTH